MTLRVKVLKVRLYRPVEVNLTIHDDSATSTAPEDYVKPMLPITLKFSTGEATNHIQEALVNITDDSLTENTEQFTCNLSSVNPAVILHPDTARVKIIDNDSESDIF